MFTKRVHKRFHRRVLVISIGLLVVIVGLSVLLLQGGPRIRKVTYDGMLLTREASQRIVLHSNQPLKDIDPQQVSLTPQVEYSVATSGETIVLQLRQRLDYGTTYTLAIQDMTTSTGRKTNFETEITTPSARYYYIKRNHITAQGILAEKELDTIRHGTLADESEGSTIYTAHQILDYAILGDELVILSAAENGAQNLVIYNEAQNRERIIPLPEEGTISRLAASPNGKLLGFLFRPRHNTSNTYEQSLLIYDVVADSLAPVQGVGSANDLQVTSWYFHPDGSSLILQTLTNVVLLVDAYHQHQPVAIGSYHGVGNFSQDGSQVIVTSLGDGLMALNLRTHDKEIPKPTQPNAVISHLRILQNSSGFLQVSGSYSEITKVYRKVFEMTNNTEVRELYGADMKEVQIGDFGISDNDQYLTLDASSMATNWKLDDYTDHPKPINIRTLIVNTKTRDTVKEVDGFKLTWR